MAITCGWHRRFVHAIYDAQPLLKVAFGCSGRWRYRTALCYGAPDIASRLLHALIACTLA